MAETLTSGKAARTTSAGAFSLLASLADDELLIVLRDLPDDCLAACSCVSRKMLVLVAAERDRQRQERARALALEREVERGLGGEQLLARRRGALLLAQHLQQPEPLAHRALPRRVGQLQPVRHLRRGWCRGVM